MPDFRFWRWKRHKELKIACDKSMFRDGSMTPLSDDEASFEVKQAYGEQMEDCFRERIKHWKATHVCVQNTGTSAIVVYANRVCDFKSWDALADTAGLTSADFDKVLKWGTEHAYCQRVVVEHGEPRMIYLGAASQGARITVCRKDPAQVVLLDMIVPVAHRFVNTTDFA